MIPEKDSEITDVSIIYLYFPHAVAFRWVHSHSSGHPDLLGGGGWLLRGGKAQAAEVCHQLLQTSTAGL